MARQRSLSGIRVTGRFHLGNYLGAGINYVRLQDHYESYIFVADYHTLTTKPNARDFTDDLYDMVMDLVAIGLDPERTVMYRQSQIPEVAELSLLLAMVTPLSWVQRVPTFKEKVRDQPENVNLGLFEYPVLQCADIVIVKGDALLRQRLPRAADRTEPGRADRQGHRRQGQDVEEPQQHRWRH